MISYENLWKIMQQRGISQYALIKKYHVSPAQITRLAFPFTARGKRFVAEVTHGGAEIRER